MINVLKKILFPNELNRHKWVEQELSKIKNDSKILDAGCGTQRYKEFCDHLQYYGQDFGKYTGEGIGLQAKGFKYGKLNYIGDIWDIDEKNDNFDAILCTEVLEHIPYPNETIAEFSRLLKPDGVLLLTAPFVSLPHFQPYYYYSGFSKEWYEYNLKKYNLEIVEILPNGDFFTLLIQENLRGIQIIKNPILKVFYSLVVGPKILADLIIAKFNKNYQLVFGYHVVAKKIH